MTVSGKRILLFTKRSMSGGIISIMLSGNNYLSLSVAKTTTLSELALMGTVAFQPSQPVSLLLSEVITHALRGK